MSIIPEGNSRKKIPRHDAFPGRIFIAMQRNEHITVAAGLIWRRDGKVLVTRRPQGIEHAGCWELPGGKLEQGEDPASALVRELREELDVEIEPGSEFARVAHEYPRYTVTLIGIHARIVSGDPRCIEVADFRWLWPDELSELEFPEANEQLFASGWRKPPDGWVKPEPLG